MYTYGGNFASQLGFLSTTMFSHVLRRVNLNLPISNFIFDTFAYVHAGTNLLRVYAERLDVVEDTVVRVYTNQRMNVIQVANGTMFEIRSSMLIPLSIQVANCTNVYFAQFNAYFISINGGITKLDLLRTASMLNTSVIPSPIDIMACGTIGCFANANNSIYAWDMNPTLRSYISLNDTVSVRRFATAPNNIMQIAAGDMHFLLLSTEGKVYGFGLNLNNQMLFGTTVVFADVITEIPLQNVKRIHVGYTYSIYEIDSKLHVLGQMDRERMNHVLTVPNNEKIDRIAPLVSIFCAISSSGNAYLLGRLIANTFLPVDGILPFAAKPVETKLCNVLNCSDIDLIDGSIYGAYALQRNGDLFIWGHRWPFLTVPDPTVPVRIAQNVARVAAFLADISIVFRNGTIMEYPSRTVLHHYNSSQCVSQFTFSFDGWYGMVLSDIPITPSYGLPPFFYTLLWAVAFAITLLMCGLVFFCLAIALLIKQKYYSKRAHNIEGSLLLEDEDESSDISIHFSTSIQQIDFAEFSDLVVIGQGTQGMVLKTTWKGELVAVKLYNSKSIAMNDGDFKDFEHELEILFALRHPNVVCLHNYLTFTFPDYNIRCCCETTSCGNSNAVL